jgi:RNA polymerase sigma-70 factor (ECF subfamily)
MRGLRSPAPTPTLPPLDLADEADLVERARWDRRAFAPLYRHYVAPVYGYCYHRLGTKEAAEDATSLVFAKALTSLPSHHGGSFRAWLFGITHHVVADALRTRGPDEPLDAATVVGDASPSLEELVLVDEDRRLLRHLLAQLPPGQRHIVELRLAGLTSAEIGLALRRSRGAVDVAYHRALVRLRTLVGDAANAQEEHRGRD